jgi:glycosyltransferase involved in cell wall biosynthesis
LNILIVVSSLDYGGAEKQAVEDANMLCSGNKVFLIAFNNGPLENQIDKRISIKFLKRSGYLRTSKNIASIIRQNQISIVHAHLYAPMVLSAIAGRLTDVPVIWNFHSHAFENSFKGKMIHKYSARLFSVKKILFPTTELDQYYDLQGYGFSSKKCQLAYNSGQKIEKFSGKAKNAGDRKIHIGFIGRVIPLKRIDLLIGLAKFLMENEISNFTIDVVGDGPELERLIKTSKDNHLESLITFHGFQHDTLSYYRQFDIFALPSGEEVLSLSLIDAGLSGLPSVAFNVGGNHEIINDGHTGFLVDSPESFFNRIKDLVNNKILREQLGSNACAECLSKFSPEARLDYLSKLYAQFV